MLRAISYYMLTTIYLLNGSPIQKETVLKIMAFLFFKVCYVIAFLPNTFCNTSKYRLKTNLPIHLVPKNNANK